MVKRMRIGVCERRKFFPPCSIRLVIHGPTALVRYHVPLCVEFLLRHCWQQCSHSIGFEPQSYRKLIGRNCLEVVGSIEPCGPVQCPARTLHKLKVLVRLHMLGALKEHVLKQMGEAGTSVPLVRRTHVIPEVDRYYGRGMILGERDEKPVLQPECLYWNAHDSHWFQGNIESVHLHFSPHLSLQSGQFSCLAEYAFHSQTRGIVRECRARCGYGRARA